MKVDGFRVDAVPFLFEDKDFTNEPSANHPTAKPTEHESLKHTYTMDQDETFELIYELRAYVDQYNTEHADETPR